MFDMSPKDFALAILMIVLIAIGAGTVCKWAASYVPVEIKWQSNTIPAPAERE